MVSMHNIYDISGGFFFIDIFHRAAGVIFLNLKSDHVKSLNKICW